MRQLQAFVAVCRAGSISAASRELYIAQPALTRQIAALERAAGHPLLVRRSNGVEPTPRGEDLLRRARPVVAAYEDLARRPQAPVERVVADRPKPVLRRGLDLAQASLQSLPDLPGATASDVLRLGVESDVPQVVGQALRDFAVRCGPGARFTKAHEEDLWGLLAAGRLDVLVVWLPPPSAGLASVPVLDVEYWAAMPVRLAAGLPAAVPRRVLADRPVALWDRADDPLAYDYWLGLLSEGLDDGVQTTPTYPLDYAQAGMLAAVADGNAVSVVIAEDWPSLSRPEVVARPFDPPLVAPLRLSWRSESPSPWTTALLEVIAALQPDVPT